MKIIDFIKKSDIYMEFDYKENTHKFQVHTQDSFLTKISNKNEVTIKVVDDIYGDVKFNIVIDEKTNKISSNVMLTDNNKRFIKDCRIAFVIGDTEIV